VLADLLDHHVPADPAETADLARVRALVDGERDPWSRELPLHVTGSALIVHPPTARVLLRWHARQGAWLHVGGHGDPGETDPLAVALREGAEETGLTDLRPLRGGRLMHVVVVPVPAKGEEPAHEHADLRFVLATGTPDAVRPEKPDALVRWVSFPEAYGLVALPNLHLTLRRAETPVARD
jgi:8-oxo-dGTP pyrophosphatase MutT (NUDIX family)